MMRIPTSVLRIVNSASDFRAMFMSVFVIELKFERFEKKSDGFGEEMFSFT